MQWHWGNIGSFLAGLSTVVVAAAVFIRGPAALRDWRRRQRVQAGLAREELKNYQMERRRGLNGWSRHGINTYPVELVTDPAGLEQATRELTSSQPTAYVVLRITAATDAGSANLAKTLRQTIETEGVISRAPTTGEIEALEAGIEALGIRENDSAEAWKWEMENPPELG